jgi:hypothetical protein
MRSDLLWLVLIFGVGCSSSDATFPGAGGAGGATATTGNGAAGGSNTNSTGTAGSGGEAGAGGMRPACTWSPDTNSCGEGFYCNATDCQTGFCEEVVKNNDAMKDAVCGCDGVNYWNTTTATAYGMPVASTGECAQPATCAPTDVTPCPSMRHFCGQLVGSAAECVIDPTISNGVCWGMPESCDALSIGGTWRRCNNEACVDECSAIKDKRKHFEDLTCPQ